MYALLTGLNAATVGIIALAAVQLSQKAITDKLTRILVFLGATAGMLYNALWYFPLLMFLGGTSTIIWDYRWGHELLRRLRPKTEATNRDSEANVDSVGMREAAPTNPTILRNPTRSANPDQIPRANDINPPDEELERIVPAAMDMRVFSWKFGVTVIACFFVTFIIVMILRGVLKNRPRGFNLFANLYLAGRRSRHSQFSKGRLTKCTGTIIFGGGPVVIPLLRE